MLIGICGGIGSGKSVVSRIMRLRGFPVYDCDREARRIMDSSEELLGLINSRLGNEVCPPGGPIDRTRLAHHVFGNDDVRLWLNNMVHRLVRADVKTWLSALEADGASCCFVESAILASSGLIDLCDRVWLLSAPEPTRIARVKARDAAEEGHIRERIRSQQEEVRLIEKSGLPTVVIYNDNHSQLLKSLML